jgi:hypothetical protein
MIFVFLSETCSSFVTDSRIYIYHIHTTYHTSILCWRRTIYTVYYGNIDIVNYCSMPPFCPTLLLFLVPLLDTWSALKYYKRYYNRQFNYNYKNWPRVKDFEWWLPVAMKTNLNCHQRQALACQHSARQHEPLC